MSKSKPAKPPIEKFSITEDTDLFTLQLKNDKLKNIIKDYNERYLYWDEVQRRDKIDEIDYIDLWKLLKLNRTIKARQIAINEHAAYTFQYNYTDHIAKQLHRFDLNLGGVLEGSTTIPEGQGDRYMINALMEEAIASSQLEGAATTRKAAKELLRSERAPKNQSEKMIVNNYLTIQEIKKYTETKLTPELILKLHKTITNQTLLKRENEGKFRETNDVKVVDGVSGEIYYDPPPHETIEKTINDICKFANHESNNEFIHPILRAISLHFLIGYLHPFVDGNGRTARALFYWYLLSKGYWLLEYISISKMILNSPAQYARSYICTEDDDNDLTYFFNYNLKIITQSLKGFRRYVSKQIETKTKIYDLNKIDGLNERQVEIIFKIQKEKHKMFSIKEIQNTFGTVYQTARTDLDGLVRLELLVKKKSGKKLLFHRSEKFNQEIEKLRKKQ